MYEELRKYQVGPKMIFDKLKKICSESGFNLDSVEETNKRLKLSSGLSLFSYGENIEVVINRDKDGGSCVHINSKPKIWFNITAEGNNKRNVQQIFELIEKELT